MAAPTRQEEEDEELEDMPEEEKARDPLRHARIKRVIQSRTFTGYVEDIEVGKVSGDILYRVRYSDGDVEHFTAVMVREMQDLETNPQPKVLPKKPAQSPPICEATETTDGAECGGTPGKSPPEAGDVDMGEGEEEEEQEQEEEQQELPEEGEVSKKPAAATKEDRGDSTPKAPGGPEKKPAARAAEEAVVEGISKKPAATMDEEWCEADEPVELEEGEEEDEEEDEECAEEEEQGSASTVLKKPAAKLPVQKEIAKPKAKGVFKRPAAK